MLVATLVQYRMLIGDARVRRTNACSHKHTHIGDEQKEVVTKLLGKKHAKRMSEQHGTNINCSIDLAVRASALSKHLGNV